MLSFVPREAPRDTSEEIEGTHSVLGDTQSGSETSGSCPCGAKVMSGLVDNSLYLQELIQGIWGRAEANPCLFQARESH